jgi:predicted metal-dependent hydrolase
MEMSTLLLDESLNILYTDTDCAKSTDKITELERYKHLDHNNLGGLKHEETYSESIFLLPKVYGGIIKDSESQFTKVKGFKNHVEFSQLKDLLFNKELKLYQDKWLRNWMRSEIKIMKSPYLLSLNENKRIIDFETLKTKPYHFDSYDPEFMDLF